MYKYYVNNKIRIIFVKFSLWSFWAKRVNHILAEDWGSKSLFLATTSQKHNIYAETLDCQVCYALADMLGYFAYEFCNSYVYGGYLSTF